MTTSFVTKACIVCGEKSSVQVEEPDIERWLRGEHVQVVWPQKSPEWRELLISGTHPECWDRIFKDSVG